MTEDDEDRSLANIELCRRLNRSAGEKYAEHGVAHEDISIAAVYSAHDLAMHAGRDPHGAIEWMRSALDVMESKFLDQASKH